MGLYLAVIENDKHSDISDAKNEGELLRHYYVVRKCCGFYFQCKRKIGLIQECIIELRVEWERQGLSIITFMDNPYIGEILQVVRLRY